MVQSAAAYFVRGFCLMAGVLVSGAVAQPGEWKPVPGPISTVWAEQVDPARPLPEYPRPLMAREAWESLNGLWEYAIREEGGEEPEAFDGKILVPFAVESSLSGVGKVLEPDATLWYRRMVQVPETWAGKRVLLHFGAVDHHARVWLNGTFLGEHRGGYDPFSFDLTDALKDGGENTLVVAVQDPTDAGGQPRGKQVRNPSGIYYTRSSGIWQTVWMEPVPETHVESMAIRSDRLGSRIMVDVEASGTIGDDWIWVEVMADEEVVSSGRARPGERVTLPIKDLRVWTPEDPFLYGLRVSVVRDGGTVDEVQSYCGVRDVRIGKDASGVMRILLNDEPVFQFGPLDQGYWPEGLVTPPSDEALRFDVEAVKRMGGNMLRKHVKVESQRFYHWCDRLGVLVWQDMPSANNPPEAREQFEDELRRMVDALSNHPSIVMWVPFNEGWGQYETERIVGMVRGLDPTRLVNNASGWTDRGVGDVIDVHIYPGPGMAPPEDQRASVLGEFGGLGLPIEGHLWIQKDNWGYVSYSSKEALTAAYIASMEQLRPLIAQGLSAAVYTQTSDVEIEVNGWLTYDRKVWKIEPALAKAATVRLYEPPPKVRTVIAAANKQPATWRYTMETPEQGWQTPLYDDSGWKSGLGGFGSKGTPGAVIGTEWTGETIWIRRTFELREMPKAAHLLIHHDEEAEVFINGVAAGTFQGYTTSYVFKTLPIAARASLKIGTNTIAIRCRQTRGGQYIDAGIVDIVEP